MQQRIKTPAGSLIPQTGAIDGAANSYSAPLEFEISRTGSWRGKAARCLNIIGRRASFTASIQNDIVPFAIASGASILEMSGSETLEIVSTNANDTSLGTGIRTVRITYIDALNTVGAENTVTISMNGTTPVSLGSVRALAIQWAEAATVGTGSVAAGDITIRQTGSPTNVYEQITTGGNRSLSARYMVPVGRTAYCDQWSASAISHDMDLRLRATVRMADRVLVPGVYIFQDATFPASNNVSPSRELLWLAFPAGSKIKLSAIPSATGGSPRSEGSFSLVEIEN